MTGLFMQGTLFVVATPIGHLEDITLRALRVLKEVDLIACEDTRHTRKLLARHGIRTPMISYHEHNERQRCHKLMEKLRNGTRIALVSDAGTPTISDPGLILIQQAIAEAIPVVPIPGPSAVIAALMAAGVPTERCLFVGFLPAKRTARQRELESLGQLPYTLIFYEAPHRIRATVQDMLDILGDRPAVLGRELTKLHEEFLRADLSKVLERLAAKTVKGELILIVAGASQSELRRLSQTAREHLNIDDEVNELMETANLDLKSAVRQVAKEWGLTKNQVYKEVIKQKK